MIIPSRSRAFCVALAAAAACSGALAALHYHRLGLTLSHYDARGHLVVARRIADSLTPGWQQIGAVWLPLPHVLNAVPIQVDYFYQTGASGVAISIAAFALTTAALAWLILAVTASRWAAAAGVTAFALNPNVLYLQSTPMTEPLSLGLTTLAVALLVNWSRRPESRRPDLQVGRDVHHTDPATEFSINPATIGTVFTLACLTRYEAWPVTVAALGLAAVARRLSGDPWWDALRAVGVIARYPALALAAFAMFSRVVIGRWLVTGGFFVPENTALGHPLEALSQIGSGLRALSGDALLVAAGVGLIGLGVLALRDRSRAWVAIPLSLAAAASLPWVAFLGGHPHRIRYMIPLIAVEALGVGVAAGFSKRAAPLAAVALLLVAAFQLRPLDSAAPMVVEATWDRPNGPMRQTVTDCLRSRYAGDAIMASMGSLGHYMQELSLAGLDIDEFLHEGNGDIWLAALEHPRPYAGWILIEEQAEGGDMLAGIARRNPAFLKGFSRICDGAGVALYGRDSLVLSP